MTADRDCWTDERLDDFARLVAPAVTVMASTGVELDMLKESLAQHRELMRERFDRQDAMLARIDGRCAETNGRVGALELAAAHEKGARDTLAAGVETERVRIAHKLARHGWIKPTVFGGATSLFVVVLSKLIGA